MQVLLAITSFLGYVVLSVLVLGCLYLVIQKVMGKL